MWDERVCGMRECVEEGVCGREGVWKDRVCGM